MYAIETDLGRFEGETEREAKRKLQTAKRKHNREAAERERIREAARSVAYKHAYAFYSRYLSGEKCAPAWLLYRGADSYGFKILRMYPHDVDGNTLDFDTPDGHAKINYWRAPVLTGVIIDGGGYAKAIELDCGDGPQLFAVGYSQDIAVLEPLFGIPVDWFPAGKH